MNSLKVVLKIGFTVTLALLLQRLLPWWSIAVAAFLISLIISTKATSSFIAGFLAIGMLWFATAAINDMRTDSILTNRIAAIFSLPSSFLLIVITAIIGGLVGGFAALTGTYLRSWIAPTEEF